ncbi:MAG: HEPN domain-containing protein [bacterium]|nr:HEPN domain-containing protein [bacterium]
MLSDDIAALTARYAGALEWARRFIEMGEYIKSIQDSYYSAFYAAKAALIHLGIRSKSHQSVQGRIDELVDSGVLRPDTRGVLGVLLGRRNESAYRFARGNWTEQEASEALDLAERFVSEMERLLASPSPRKSRD